MNHENHILSQFFLRLANAHEASEAVDECDMGTWHAMDGAEHRALIMHQATMVRVLVNYVLANGERIKDEAGRL